MQIKTAVVEKACYNPSHVGIHLGYLIFLFACLFYFVWGKDTSFKVIFAILGGKIYLI